MQIVGISQDIIWKNPAENFRFLESELSQTNADVFVLPEMFSTGFCMDAAEIADSDETTLRWLQKMAAEKNAAFTGSAAVAEGGKFYNRIYFVKPDGSYDFYDKRHLFSYSGEDKIFTPGSTRKIVEYRGVRFLLQVCYDLRFPVFARNCNDYDVILYIANWPESRIAAWKLLLQARAVENQCCVFGVNRTGTDGNNLQYPESTLAFFADGTEITERKGVLNSWIFDAEKLLAFRKKYPFLKDADDFELKL